MSLTTGLVTHRQTRAAARHGGAAPLFQGLDHADADLAEHTAHAHDAGTRSKRVVTFEPSDDSHADSDSSYIDDEAPEARHHGGRRGKTTADVRPKRRIRFAVPRLDTDSDSSTLVDDNHSLPKWRARTVATSVKTAASAKKRVAPEPATSEDELTTGQGTDKAKKRANRASAPRPAKIQKTPSRRRKRTRRGDHSDDKKSARGAPSVGGGNDARRKTRFKARIVMVEGWVAI